MLRLLALSAVAEIGVSILISPEGLMLPCDDDARLSFGAVSILISPEGLMLQVSSFSSMLGGTGFNPHQPRRADATVSFHLG